MPALARPELFALQKLPGPIALEVARRKQHLLPALRHEPPLPVVRKERLQRGMEADVLKVRAVALPDQHRVTRLQRRRVHHAHLL
eukprot:CAMPEP_0171973438 /NCGR_PEP_ID=MMETSP0993-20121228/227678_1 /TAXON_ID=483369 /ORGANISM="non described non described, Strain CCMP2098" /LENGTH=84 /DNA_ID=CAMNT_0012624231 /DNA_START=20 /DNA_END=272 /DNA_ORIENTATION=-